MRRNRRQGDEQVRPKGELLGRRSYAHSLEEEKEIPESEVRSGSGMGARVKKEAWRLPCPFFFNGTCVGVPADGTEFTPHAPVTGGWGVQFPAPNGPCMLRSGSGGALRNFQVPSFYAKDGRL